MKFLPLFVLATLSLPGIVGAQSAPVNRDTVWFKPTLTVNSAPICQQLLQAEQDTFFSVDAVTDYERTGLRKLRGGMYDETIEDPQIEPVEEGVRQLILTLPDGQRVFVYFNNLGGCGGGCEAERVLVADEPFAQRPERDAGSPDAPRVVGGWQLFKSTQGDFYTIATVDDQVLAYRVAAPARLEPACEVTVRPTRFDDHKDAAVRNAWQAVMALLQTYGPISQGGWCGSLNTTGRNNASIRNALEESLFRPWAAPREDGTGLEAWSLIGLAEYRSFNRYRQQLDRSAVDVGKLYQQKFGWSESEVRSDVARILRAAFNSGFVFSSSSGEWPKDLDLRSAILERQPLSIIEELGAGVAALQDPEGYTVYDSILNVAVEYPEALRYLLDQGVDANAPNEFGKTPLMYAAQYNQLESVRILLGAGANPNAATSSSADGCLYDVQTGGMTPLHYAARYASASVIQALVAAGAGPSNRTTTAYGHVNETPLDWLRKYTLPAEETHAVTNPHIQAAELPALVKLLSTPNEPAAKD